MLFAVAAFYKFVAIDDRERLRGDLLALCRSHGVKGSILVAYEGINATIAGPPAGLEATLTAIVADDRFTGMTIKRSTAATPPFKRLKVRFKQEIVTLGRPEADPTVHVGTYVDPADWNALISDPATIVVDTRNAYEYAIGTFERAIDPGTRAFGEFPAFVASHLDPARHRKVAMFCTGGIRCEKATAFMLDQGFENVFHLRGGILAYLETVPPEQSRWHGQCYVFDGRVALGHGLTEGTHATRRACGHPMPKATDGNPALADTTPCAICVSVGSSRD